MTTRMLIDATHAEETRVVVVRGNRLEEFDLESSTKLQIKGNIYLAKVTRVEPSLQAAFVEYGGNRHGFLAFNEIHPDYYQIPVEDRIALLEEEAAFVARDVEDEESEIAAGRSKAKSGKAEAAAESDPVEDNGDQEPPADPDEVTLPFGEQEFTPTSDIVAAETGADEVADDSVGEDSVGEDSVGEDSVGEDSVGEDSVGEDSFGENDAGVEVQGDDDENAIIDAVALDADAAPEVVGEDDGDAVEADAEHGDIADDDDDSVDGDDSDSSADEEVMEVARRRRARPRRNYKIQEVIKKRQILLVQVVKEERGNKGAALTTYMSLAGRYCVLMPNTARGGGVSRKITNQTARRKLKKTLTDLQVPDGMGVIVRTAGQNRTKAEIRRDFEYLFRVWDKVRALTLESSAPAVVYEEANLIKRAIRDLYTKDVSEVLVEGEEGYRTAKDFMRMLMPSHSKKVQPYRDRAPLFHRYQVHQQLDSMHSNVVTLRSGGYLVINPTEALVAVDVNSGRSTKGHNVEDTAVKTNLEAAEELARQLRLRDLAGLIVIDFIDMDENRNNRAVERKINECLKNDRARVQTGRISNFGLMEMSRQRLRPSLQEASSVICPYCEGSGVVRSTESAALQVMRAIEEEGIKGRATEISVKAPVTIAQFILNQKRAVLTDIEERYNTAVLLFGDDALILPNFEIQVTGEREQAEPLLTEPLPEVIEEDGDSGKRKRRRRRRKKKDDDNGLEAREDAAEETVAEPEEEADRQTAGDENTGASGEKVKRRRRRGRRGGKRRRENADTADADTAEASTAEADTAQAEAGPEAGEAKAAPEIVEAVQDWSEAPETIDQAVGGAADVAASGSARQMDEAAAPAEIDTTAGRGEIEDQPTATVEPEAPPVPKKRGWWQRNLAG